MSKTIKEYLNELPDGYRELALKRYDPAYYDGEDEINCLRLALLNAFDFLETPEGFTFWAGVYNYVSHNGPLPPIPEKTLGEELAECEETIFGPTPALDTRSEQVNSLRGWRIGDIAYCPEEDLVGDVFEVDSLDCTLHVSFSGDSKPGAKRYPASELTNLSRGG
jgi:hypothetical protein